MTIYRMVRYMDESGKNVIAWTPMSPPAGAAIGETGARFLGESIFSPSDKDGNPIGPGRPMQFPIEKAKSVNDAFDMFEEASDAHCDLLAKQAQEHAEKKRNKIIVPGAAAPAQIQNLRVVK